MSHVDAFADFIGDVPHRETDLPWGAAAVWDLGEGPPLVLLHGIASGRRVFFRLAPLWGGRGRVVAPPLRGEDRALASVTLDEHLDDVAALLDALGLDDVTLAGFSFGGYLALAYAARRDPRVARVAALGAFARFRLRPLDRAVLELSRLLPAALGSAYFARRVARGAEHRLLAAHTPGLETLNLDWTRKTPFATVRARTRLIARAGLAERLGRIAVPVLLARGEEDRVVPRAFFSRLTELLPQARTETIAGAGHLAVLTHPEATAALLAEFAGVGE